MQRLPILEFAVKTKTLPMANDRFDPRSGLSIQAVIFGPFFRLFPEVSNMQDRHRPSPVA